MYMLRIRVMSISTSVNQFQCAFMSHEHVLSLTWSVCWKDLSYISECGEPRIEANSGVMWLEGIASGSHLQVWVPQRGRQRLGWVASHAGVCWEDLGHKSTSDTTYFCIDMNNICVSVLTYISMYMVQLMPKPLSLSTTSIHDKKRRPSAYLMNVSARNRNMDR